MLEAVNLTVALAHDFALETRVRRLIEAHQSEGDEPRTLVMSSVTWHDLVGELEGRQYSSAYFWIPEKSTISFYKGVPILIKEFVAYGEVLVGV